MGTSPRCSKFSATHRENLLHPSHDPPPYPPCPALQPRHSKKTALALLTTQPRKLEVGLPGTLFPLPLPSLSAVLTEFPKDTAALPTSCTPVATVCLQQDCGDLHLPICRTSGSASPSAVTPGSLRSGGKPLRARPGLESVPASVQPALHAGLSSRVLASRSPPHQVSCLLPPPLSPRFSGPRIVFLFVCFF